LPHRRHGFVDNKETGMRKHVVAGTLAVAMLVPGVSFAQTVIYEERPSRGPIGDIVGGALSIPGEVVGAVVGAPPRRSVVVEEEVVVGRPLPRTVEVVPVPRHREYSYAVVNDRRVIIEPRTRRVVRIVD
jgi:hypothetical protein